MALVRAEGPLAPDGLADYFCVKLRRGFAHAHAAGLIHRDITPSNMMVGRDGTVKLLDLGLALLTDDDVDLTRGAPMGSFGYIAPEQALMVTRLMSRGISAWCHGLFRDDRPGSKPATRCERYTGSKIKAAPKYSQLLAIIERMMAPNLADRFQTATEVIEAVARLSGCTTPQAQLAPVAQAVTEVPGEDSTDFILNIEPSEPPAQAPSTSPERANEDFVFGPTRQQAQANHEAKEERATPTTASAKAHSTPVAAPQPRSVPNSGSWLTRYWWLLVLLALLVGFGTGFISQGQRPTNPNATPKLKQRCPVSPNSP